MILDASVLLAVLNRDDPFHEAALEVVSRGNHAIHAVNLGEVASILFRRDPAVADEVLDVFMAAPDLEVAYDPVEREAGRLHADRPSRKISLADCFGAALAAARSEAVVSADKDFRWFTETAGIAVQVLAGEERPDRAAP
ncbi:MAG: PIN domain-containing protein [Candidatus Sericytochromatia bacterium]|nr:PIN domain-containing protein [Candidatus Tanganyikabacteria bacterium]